jgi:hypothetical protein
MKLMPLIIIAATLSACGTTSKIAPYGKDTYLLNVEDYWGTTMPTTMQIQAAEEANNHCKKLGRTMQVKSSDNWGVTMLSSTSSSLIFTCISTAK